jgi:excisionase family DNA binding protein
MSAIADLILGGIRMNTRRVLTIKEAAQLIEGLTEYRIRQMCISGQLPCFMAGKKYLISEEALMKAVFGNCEPKDGDAA